jgi:hypothetical protein
VARATGELNVPKKCLNDLLLVVGRGSLNIWGASLSITSCRTYHNQGSVTYGIKEMKNVQNMVYATRHMVC